MKVNGLFNEDSPQRGKLIQLRVTEEELEMVKAEAKRRGVKKATFLRMCIKRMLEEGGGNVATE